MIPTFFIKMLAPIIAIVAIIFGFKVWLVQHDKNILIEYVQKAEYDALLAVSKRDKNLLLIAQQSAVEEKKHFEMLQLSMNEKIKQLMKDVNNSLNLTYPNDEDLSWLEKH